MQTLSNDGGIQGHAQPELSVLPHLVCRCFKHLMSVSTLQAICLHACSDQATRENLILELTCGSRCQGGCKVYCKALGGRLMP